MELTQVNCHKCGKGFRVLNPQSQAFCSKLCAGGPAFSQRPVVNFRPGRKKKGSENAEWNPDDNSHHEGNEVVASYMADPAEDFARFKFDD